MLGWVQPSLGLAATIHIADYEFKRLHATATEWIGPLATTLQYDDMTIVSMIHWRERRTRRGLPEFPDGEFLLVMPLNCAEAIFTAARLHWPTTHRRLAAAHPDAQQPASAPLLWELRMDAMSARCSARLPAPCVEDRD